MTCADCGSEEVMAFWPGHEGVSTDLFRLTPGRPMQGWCAKCWAKRYAPDPAPPRSGGKSKAAVLTKKC